MTNSWILPGTGEVFYEAGLLSYMHGVKPGTALFTSVHVPDIGVSRVLLSVVIQLSNSLIVLCEQGPGLLS